MKIVYHLVLLLTVLSVISCEQTRERNENTKIDPKYFDFLNPKSGWRYIIHDQNAGAGIYNDLAFGVYATKYNQNKLDVYTCAKIMGQQGYLYTFKLLKADLNDPFSFTTQGCKFYIQNQSDMIYNYLMLQEDSPADYYFTYYRFYSQPSILEVSDTTGKIIFKGSGWVGGGTILPAGNKMYYVSGGEYFKELTPDGSGITIWNYPANPNMACAFIYFQPEDEIHEIFISKYGHLSVAVMQKESIKDETHMVDVGYTKETTFSSPIQLFVKKKFDNTCTIMVYSPDSASIDVFLYNPSNYTITPVNLNVSVPGKPEWADVADDGTIYMASQADKRMEQLKRYRNGKWESMSLDVFNNNYAKGGTTFFTGFTLKHNLLFGYVACIQGDVIQASVIQYMGE